MIPSQAMITAALAAAAGNGGLASPSGHPYKAVLVVSPFTPSPNIAYADLTLNPTGTNLGAKTALDQPFTVLQDPLTAERVLTLDPPAGGWRWESDTTGSFPISVYGVAIVTDDMSPVLVASMTLATPVTITASGQLIELAELAFRTPANPFK